MTFLRWTRGSAERGFPLFFCLGVLVTLLYVRGLHDTIWLDSTYWFAELREGDPEDWRQLLAFVLEGKSGPTGRPVTRLTFALQFAFLQEVWTFRLVNVFFHLLNGFLIWRLARRLLRFRLEEQTSEPVALFAAALWLLHPLHISTVLYVVQRLVLVATLFMLLALLTYLHFREAWQEGDTKGVLLWGGMTATTSLLAVFSKEIGALLPVYLAVLEGTLLLRNRFSLRPPVYLAALLPLGVVLHYTDWHTVYHKSTGDFTAYERLLTECRLLLWYLRQILLPDVTQMSLYLDDIELSKSLLEPPETLLAVLAVVALLTLAIALRCRWPLYSFALLWFFGGHLLESTTIGLELAYEHRNYLPAFGPLFALSYALVGRPLPAKLAKLQKFAPALLLLLFAVQLGLRVDRWRDPWLLARYWADRYPDSYRTQEILAKEALARGYGDIALRAIERSITIRPNTIEPYLKKAAVLCAVRSTGTKDFLEELDQVVTSNRVESNYVMTRMLQGLLQEVLADRCPLMGREAFERLLLRLVQNPKLRPADRANVWEILAVLYVRGGRKDPLPEGGINLIELQVRAGDGWKQAKALDALLRSLELYPRLSTAQALAYWALAAGDVPLAQEAFKRAKGLVGGLNPVRRSVAQRELARLEEALRKAEMQIIFPMPP